MLISLNCPQEIDRFRSLSLECAAEVASRFHPTIGSELQQEALSYLWQRFHMRAIDLHSPTIRGLIHLTLRRRGIDLYRQRKRQTQMIESTFELESLPDAQEGQGITFLEERLKKVRSVLTTLSWPTCATTPDYFAVLLLHFRLSFANALHRAKQQESIQCELLLGDLAEYCLPWTIQEQQRCCVTGTPTIDQVWHRLLPTVNTAPQQITSSLICSQLKGSTQRTITANCWYQWTRRARLRVKQSIPAKVWEECFTPWLPKERS